MPKKFNLTGRSRLLKLALTKAGSEALLARQLGVSRQAINLWKIVPPDRKPQIRKYLNAR